MLTGAQNTSTDLVVLTLHPSNLTKRSVTDHCRTATVIKISTEIYSVMRNSFSKAGWTVKVTFRPPLRGPSSLWRIKCDVALYFAHAQIFTHQQTCPTMLLRNYIGKQWGKRRFSVLLFAARFPPCRAAMFFLGKIVLFRLTACHRMCLETFMSERSMALRL